MGAGVYLIDAGNERSGTGLERGCGSAQRHQTLVKFVSAGGKLLCAVDKPLRTLLGSGDARGERGCAISNLLGTVEQTSNLVAIGICVALDASNELLGTLDKAGHSLTVGIRVAVDAGSNLLGTGVQVARTLRESSDAGLKAGVLLRAVAGNLGSKRRNLVIGLRDTGRKAGRRDDKTLLGVVNGALDASKAGADALGGLRQRADAGAQVIDGRFRTADGGVCRGNAACNYGRVVLGLLKRVARVGKVAALARSDAEERRASIANVG